MTRTRVLLAGIAALLVACSGAAAPTKTATPLPTIDAASATTSTSAGPYPVVSILPGGAVQLDRGGEGGLSTVGLVGAVSAAEGRCFADQALAETHRLLDGQRVRVVADPTVRSDAGGRPLAYVWLESGRMLNDVLVEGGFAREATGAAGYVYRDTFARSEALARGAERGLWAADACGGNITTPAVS